MAIEFTPHSKVDFSPHADEDFGIFDPANQTSTGTVLPKNAYKSTRSFIPGAVQGAANYPIKIANLVRENPLSEFNFAPQDTASEFGQGVGDFAAFGLPRAGARLGLKALEKIPQVQKGTNAITKFLDSTPWLKSILGVGKPAGEAALYGAAHNPLDSGIGALTGGATGGALQVGANLIGNTNPLVSLLARSGVGAGAGYFVDPSLQGASAGALVGATAPSLLKSLGLSSKNALIPELLEGIEPKDINRVMAANRRLGTTVTPAQASGNYVTSQAEGELKRTAPSARAAYRYEKMQSNEQNRAVNAMLDSLYKPSPANDKIIDDLYEKAYRHSIEPETVAMMQTNHIMKQAFDLVRADPVFKEIPENNYEFLAEVDRTLFRMQNGALPAQQYVISKLKNDFNGFLKHTNPDYEAATKAAQPKIVRENIIDKLNRENDDVTGKNFYSRFMQSRGNYRALLRDTANFPQAQQAIKDMRTAWKHLSNIKTVSQSEAQAKAGISDARDWSKVIMNAIKKAAGARNDIEGLNFIYSKDWDKKGFEHILKMEDHKARNKALLSFFGKMAIIYGLQ